MMSVYLGEFNDWADVVREFDLPPETPEPGDVFALYDTMSYEGDALVIIRRPGELFDVVEANHCSCDGLEYQFNPTEGMPLEAVRAMLNSKDDFMDSGAFRALALRWVGGEPLRGA